MNVDPFWLNDRIVPSDANYPREIRTLGSALAELEEDTGDHSLPAVAEAVRWFQNTWGLKVEGEAQVKGLDGLADGITIARALGVEANTDVE